MSDPRTLKEGRYLLVSPLGEGGMATVYRAFDQRLGVWRAVKLLLPQVARRKKLRQRFETEARTMAVLEHKHIVRIYDVDRDGDHLFMVMELLTGGALVDWIEEHGAMPPQMACKAMLQVCQGVAYAHKRGVVHRDLKPHNVLLDADGLCKVTDFGIARAADPDRSLTQTGAIMGTHGYMAPEQKVDAKNVDDRADIYALGATLWALLANRPPPDLFVAFQSPEMLEPVPEPLREVVMNATEYMVEDRYETVEEFAQALRIAGAELDPDPRDAPPLKPPATPELPAPSVEEFNVTAAAGSLSGVTIAPSASQTAVPKTVDRTAAESTLASELDAPSFTLGDGDGPKRSRAVWLVPVFLGGILLAAGGAGVAGLALYANQGSATVDPPAPIVAPAPPALPAPVPTVAPEPVAVATPVPEPVAAPTPRPSPAPSPRPVPVPAPRPAPEPITVVVPAPVPDPRPVTVVVAPAPVAAPAPAPAPMPASTVPADCIDLSPPRSVAVGSNATFAASLCPEVSGPVVLHYRASGGAWQRQSMSVALGSYRTQIPVDAPFARGFEYYVTAGEASIGSRSAPRTLSVR